MTQGSENDLHYIGRLAALAELVLPPQGVQPLLMRIAEVATELLPAYGASVILWDERTEAYTVSSTTVPGQQVGTITTTVRRQGGATRWIIDNREPLIVTDTASHQLGGGRLIEEHGVRSFVGLPLLDGDRVLGVLYALDRQHRDYPPVDLAFLVILAQRAANAICHARLVDELEHALARTDALARVGHALIEQAHDLDGLLQRLSNIVVEAIDAGVVLLLLSDPERRRIDHFITAGSESPLFHNEGYATYDRGLTGWVIRHGETAISPAGVLDARQSFERLPGGGSSEADAIVVVPITAGHRVAGTLTVIRKAEQGDFNDREVALLEAMADQASLAISQARLHETMKRLATTDDLTGLPNRRQLHDQGRQAFARTRRHQRSFAVAVIDLDHFKRINDRHGHAIGDEVLRQFAVRARTCIRGVDILGRVGGEEFALLLPEADPTAACAVADRLRSSVAEAPFPTERGTLEITVTIGVALATAETASLDDIFERADAALYRGKEEGRNRVVVDEAR